MSETTPKEEIPPPPTQEIPIRRVDASMTLINEVMHRPLDPSYAAAARDKKLNPATNYKNTRATFILVLAVLMGVVVTVAVKELRAPQPAALAARTILEEQIKDRRLAVADLRHTNESLQSQIEQLRDATLAEVNPELLQTVRKDSIINGSITVEGPGLIIKITDGPGAHENYDFAVHDSDLQSVINSLWASGAEAISVNDYRLTPTTAIRSAGETILIDLQAITSPYEIKAIGEEHVFERNFELSVGAGQLNVLNQRYGIGYQLKSEKSIKVIQGSPMVLFYAKKIEPDS